MRILVDISMEYYEQMVNRVDEHSRLHSILMNGVVVTIIKPEYEEES